MLQMESNLFLFSRNIKKKSRVLRCGDGDVDEVFKIKNSRDEEEILNLANQQLERCARVCCFSELSTIIVVVAAAAPPDLDRLIKLSDSVEFIRLCVQQLSRAGETRSENHSCDGATVFCGLVGSN